MTSQIDWTQSPMTTMDKVKYCLTIWQNNKAIITQSYVEYYGFPMKKAIELYNKGLRRENFQQLSILCQA